MREWHRTIVLLILLGAAIAFLFWAQHVVDGSL